MMYLPQTILDFVSGNKRQTNCNCKASDNRKFDGFVTDLDLCKIYLSIIACLPCLHEVCRTLALVQNYKIIFPRPFPLGH